MGIRARELLLLLVSDVVVLGAALWLSLAARHLALPSGEMYLAHAQLFAVVALVWLSIFWLFGLYDKHTTAFLQEVFRRLVGALVVGAAAAVVLFFLLPTDLAPKTILALYTLFVGAGVAVSRFALLWLTTRRKKARAVVVGEGQAVEALAEEVRANPFRYPFMVVAVVSPKEARRELPALSHEGAIEWLIVQTDHPSAAQEIGPLLVWATEHGARPVSLLAMYEHIFDRVPLTTAYPILLDHLLRSSARWYEPIKRAFDIVFALVALAVVVLLIPLVWLAYRLEGVQGGVWYIHGRVGKGMRPFRAVKFRTLTRLDPEGQLLDEAPNPPTRVGKVLRALSLDELPQAINVLKGEMSFIGPRADALGVAKRLVAELPLYPLRYLVQPGITGWAQTHQRYPEGKISPQNVEESAERLAYDLHYIAHYGWWVDGVVLFRTVRTLLERVITFLLLVGKGVPRPKKNV